MTPLFHVIIYAPLTHADTVRDALARSGAGKIGKYDSCTFTVRGTGRFRPLPGADPAIGEIGKLELVEEERIEVEVAEKNIGDVIKAVRAVHPYEEPAIHVIPMRDYKEFMA